jgi:hypothetical protein
LQADFTLPGSLSPAAPVKAVFAEASGTPTFFINGRRHYGSYDITALTTAVLAAKAAGAAPAR